MEEALQTTVKTIADIYDPHMCGIGSSLPQALVVVFHTQIKKIIAPTALNGERSRDQSSDIFIFGCRPYILFS